MELKRVDPTVTLVNIPNDWTSSSTLVAFMGHYLALYRIAYNEMDCIF